MDNRWVPALLSIAVCASCGGGSTRLGGRKEAPPLEPACKLLTDFPDDKACLSEVDPESGFSLHFGPDDYGNPGEYVLPPGEEATMCKILGTPPGEVFVERWVGSARSGVHHFELLAGPPGIDPCKDHRARLLLISDTSRLYHQLGEAPEYAGAALRIGPDEQLALQVHAINATRDPLLREVWLNAHTVTRFEMSLTADTLAMVSTQNGNQTDEFGGAAALSTDRPLLGLSGHADNVDELKVFHVRGGERTLIYRQSDFVGDMHFLRFDSLSQNSNDEKDYSNGRVGGSSGPVVLLAGDRLEWSCHGPPPSLGLRFPTARTCAVRGWYLPSAGHWLNEP